MKNSERFLSRFLQNYTAEKGIRCNALSHDWVYLLRRRDASYVVFGYDLGLNSSTTFQLCRDKTATYEVLAGLGIAAVPHHLLTGPHLAQYMPDDGCWRAAISHFEQYGCDVVVKDNEGTSGKDVSRVRTQSELETAVVGIFAKERNAAISPFTRHSKEVRLYCLDGEIVLAYEKVRPHVVGDGKSTVLELAARRYQHDRLGEMVHNGRAGVGYLSIPRDGERVDLDWQSNLGRGAAPQLLALSTIPALCEIAVSVASAIALQFGSIDLFVSDDESLAVLEVNAGVMMENLASSGEDGRNKATEIYRRAMDLRLSR